MENADEKNVFNAITELRATLNAKQSEYLTKTELDAKLSQVTDDIIAKLHPVQKKTPLEIAADNPTDENINSAASAFKYSKHNVKSKPWTSPYGKQFGDMRNFIKSAMTGQVKTYSGNNMTTAGDGGDLVPTEFVNRVIEIAQETSIIFQIANILPMSGSKRNLPTQATGATVYWPGEAIATTLSKPTFSIVNQIAKKMAVHCKMTKELMWDSSIDLENFLARIVAYAVGQEVERVALVGNTGAGDPFMGVRYASGAVSAATAATLTFNNMTELIMGGSQAYAIGAELVTSRLGLKLLMQLKDGEDRPIWNAPIGPVPATVLGVPYRLSAQIPTTLSVGGESTGTTALFGNYSQYLLVSPHGGMEFLASEHATDAEGNSAFTQALLLTRWLQDISIDVAIPAAFRYLDFK